MSLIGYLHGTFVHSRRVAVLARSIAGLLPGNASVLDIGCGDGWLASQVMQFRPDVSVTGVDVLRRPQTHVPVTIYDGIRLPFKDGSCDVVLFVDVLHHTTAPLDMLREAARVGHTIIVKDHVWNTRIDWWILRFMDWVGNARHGVERPHNYWRKTDWDRAATELHLLPMAMRTELKLYAWPASWIFGRKLHFLAAFKVR